MRRLAVAARFIDTLPLPVWAPGLRFRQAAFLYIVVLRRIITLRAMRRIRRRRAFIGTWFIGGLPGCRHAVLLCQENSMAHRGIKKFKAELHQAGLSAFFAEQSILAHRRFCTSAWKSGIRAMTVGMSFCEASGTLAMIDCPTGVS